MPESPDGRRALGSWLSGPYTATDATAQDYRGQRLGLPPSGSGSVASIARRLGALLIDWLLCRLITVGLFELSEWWVPLVFAIEYVVLLSTLGSTVGMRIADIRVAALGLRRPGPLGLVVRTLLLLLVIPAVVYDHDLRGLHDRATGTVVVRR